MKRSFLLFSMISIAALWFSGCGESPESVVKKKLFSPRPDKAVTMSPEYNFSSFAGTVWKTKTKTAIADLKRYTGAPEVKLLAPQRFDRTHPEYNPPDDMKIIAVLPPGTRLRITRLMEDQGAWGGVQVEAVLEDGTNAQKAVLLDGFLLAGNRWTRGPDSNKNWDADPGMLERVDSPRQP
ncbi:MAG: hypothetical protein JWR26_4449 [Pedosphaera sp.]|nr:hypothetical protein [Pedosphaera sp.]